MSTFGAALLMGSFLTTAWRGKLSATILAAPLRAPGAGRKPSATPRMRAPLEFTPDYLVMADFPVLTPHWTLTCHSLS